MLVKKKCDDKIALPKISRTSCVCCKLMSHENCAPRHISSFIKLDDIKSHAGFYYERWQS